MSAQIIPLPGAARRVPTCAGCGYEMLPPPSPDEVLQGLDGWLEATEKQVREDTPHFGGTLAAKHMAQSLAYETLSEEVERILRGHTGVCHFCRHDVIGFLAAAQLLGVAG